MKTDTIRKAKMIELSDIERKLKKVENKIKEENSLATNVINKLIRVILCLIIFIFVNNIAWIWYISLPVEETEIVQDADTQGENSPISQEIGE